MCVPDVLLTATFLAVKEMMIYMCMPDVLVTDTFLTVKEMHDLDVCARCQDCCFEIVFQMLYLLICTKGIFLLTESCYHRLVI